MKTSTLGSRASGRGSSESWDPGREKEREKGSEYEGDVSQNDLIFGDILEFIIRGFLYLLLLTLREAATPKRARSRAIAEEGARF